MKRKNLKFAALGHSLLDSRCYLKNFPKPDGIALLLKPIMNSCGGSASNFLYNISKMGFKSRIFSAIGNDASSKFILHCLKDNGVEINFIKKFKGDSGRSIILIDKKGNVEVLESIGVSDKYFKSNKKELEGIDHLHITGANIKVLYSYSKEAKRRGLSLSADLGREKIKLGMKKLEPLFKRLNLLILNRKELGLLYGEEKMSEVEIKNFIKELNEKYGFIIAVKAGSKKSIVYDGKEYYSKKPPKVKVVDTIGAGDAFDAGFIAVYKNTGKIKNSLDFAIKIASIKIQHLGAQALPSKQNVRKMIKKYLT